MRRELLPWTTGGDAPGVRARAASPRARRVNALAFALLTIAMAAGCWSLRWSAGVSAATPDTFWYARDAFRYAGYSAPEAALRAAKITCGAMNRARPRYHPGGYARCLRMRAQYPKYAQPRFARIFTSRPGYALLTAPLVAAFGGAGFILGTALLGIACGGAVVALALACGLRPAQALLAQTAFWVLPSGLWASRLLAEAPMLLGVLLALTATVLLSRGDRGTGRSPLGPVAMLAAALAALCVIKPANGVALAGALLAASSIALLRGVRRNWLVVAGVAAMVLAGHFGISAALELPGIHETLQDTFTRHFRTPDVPDPWPRLLDEIRPLWTEVIVSRTLNEPIFLAAYVLGALGLFRTLRRDTAWLLSLAGLTGALVVSMHPLGSEADRLAAVSWIPVALGLATWYAGRRRVLAMPLPTMDAAATGTPLTERRPPEFPGVGEPRGGG